MCFRTVIGTKSSFLLGKRCLWHEIPGNCDTIEEEKQNGLFRISLTESRLRSLREKLHAD